MSDDAKLIRDRLRSVVIIRDSLGVGSGFYVADTGIIVTNAHVVGPMLSMSVQRFDRSKREARVVRVATAYDLALLWDQTASVPPPLPLAESADVAHGETVYAIGHPVGLDFTITRGIVSSTNRLMNGAYHVQTDVVMHPGSSGGPILNERGQIVGVSTFGLRSDGLNFALSVRYVHELLGQMIVKPTTGNARRCVVCGTKNLRVRRSCRKCGVPLEAEGDAPPSRPARTSTPPDAPPAEDATIQRIRRCAERLDPRPESIATRGLVLEIAWRGCALTATVFPGATEPYVSVTSPAVDLPADESARLMRLALEINMQASLEAKLGLRGGQLYVAADRALEALDDEEIVALLRRVVDVREAFLAQAG
jgi:S1-C subfamily serine protease